MASVIRSLYAALANQAVVVGTVTPQVFDVNALPNAIDTAKLPARLLLPFGANAEQGHTFNFETFGASGVGEVEWNLFDLLLWRAAPGGTTLADVAADLVTYAGKYVDMLFTNRYLVTGTQIHNARLTLGVWEYPAASGQYFYGAYATVTVGEIL